MHASWNQSAITKLQINTQEQSRGESKNQLPLWQITILNLEFINGCPQMSQLHWAVVEGGKVCVRVTATHLWTNKLPHMLKLNTLLYQGSQPWKLSNPIPHPPLPFTPSVKELSETDVQGIISMHGDSQTQTGHGRGLLNAKDSICSVG